MFHANTLIDVFFLVAHRNGKFSPQGNTDRTYNNYSRCIVCHTNTQSRKFRHLCSKFVDFIALGIKRKVSLLSFLILARKCAEAQDKIKFREKAQAPESRKPQTLCSSSAGHNCKNHHLWFGESWFFPKTYNQRFWNAVLPNNISACALETPPYFFKSVFMLKYTCWVQIAENHQTYAWLNLCHVTLSWWCWRSFITLCLFA